MGVPLAAILSHLLRMNPAFLFILSFLCLVQAHSWDKRDAFSNTGLPLASWIWYPEPNLAATAPIGDAAFLKSFTSPSPKAAASASIAIAADNNYTLWVNGQPVGAGRNWETPQVYNVQLNATTNVFAVQATNQAAGAPVDANPAGVIAAITVQYSDGSNETLLTDTTWLAANIVPAGFPAVDVSGFISAAVAAPYGSGVWGMAIDSLDLTPEATGLNLTGSQWIWSTTDAVDNAPAASVGFRATLPPSPTNADADALWASLLLSADNSFQLYVNGEFVAAPPHDDNDPNAVSVWHFAQRVNVSLASGSNVLDVIATNFVPQSPGGTSAAGLVCAGEIAYADGARGALRSDTSWRVGAAAGGAAAFLGTPDSQLVPAIVQVGYGGAPWGVLQVADVLSAERVPGAAADAEGGNAAPSPQESGSGSSSGAGSPAGSGSGSAATSALTSSPAGPTSGAAALCVPPLPLLLSLFAIAVL